MVRAFGKACYPIRVHTLDRDFKNMFSMISHKNRPLIKIIAIVISFVFTFENIGYAYQDISSKKSMVRVPLSFHGSYDRPHEPAKVQDNKNGTKTPGWRNNYPRFMLAVLIFIFSIPQVGHITNRFERSRTTFTIGSYLKQDSGVLNSYYRTLGWLSERSLQKRWSNASKPYFKSNEISLGPLYQAVENRGGVMLGVSLDQNFSLAIHGKPSIYVFLDINPVVTDVMAPFYGRLMELAPTRREFLSLLMSVELTEEDVESLLHPELGLNYDAVSSLMDIKIRAEEYKTRGDVPSYLAAKRRMLKSVTEIIELRLKAILERIPEGEREKKYALLSNILDHEILNRLMLSSSQRNQVKSWVDEFLKNLLSSEGGGYFNNFLGFMATHALAAVEANNAQEERQLGTWLSSEQNYQRLRKLWLEGRFIGITSDIMSRANLGRLGYWLRGQGKQVTTLYVSNIEEGIDGKAMYEALGALPLKEGAIVIFTHNCLGPPLIPVISRFRTMYGIYRYLNSEDAMRIMYYVIKTTLLESRRKDFGQLVDDLYRSICRVMAERSKAPDMINKEAEPYYLLCQKIKNPVYKAEIQGLDISGFTAWAKKNVPGLDTDSGIFRAIVIVLEELGITHHPDGPIFRGIMDGPATYEGLFKPLPLGALALDVKQDL